MPMRREFDRYLTEQRNPKSTQLDRLPTAEVLRLINEEDRRAVQAVRARRKEIARAVQIAVETIRAGGRLLMLGAGTSGRLAVMEAAECPPTFDTPPGLIEGIMCGGTRALLHSREGAEDRAEDGERDLKRRRLRRRDAVLGIAASGSTPYVIGALRFAKRTGCRTILITCNEPRFVPRGVADVVISLRTGPEVLTGSTRMKAGTATKLALNSITTATMVRLGKCYENLMVDIQVKSEKLLARAIRIIRTVTGVDEKTARRALKAAGGRTKVAIVMLRRNVGRFAAQRLLERADGNLRKVIG